MPTVATPWSLALRDIPHPDYADALIATLPPDTPVDPAVWAREAFSVSGMPRWVAAARTLPPRLVPQRGQPPAPAHPIARPPRVGGEVLIAADDRHLDFRCAVGVDPEARLLRVTTAVRLHGWRGRLYFAPVRLLHPVVVQAMVSRAGRRLAGHG